MVDQIGLVRILPSELSSHPSRHCRVFNIICSPELVGCISRAVMVLVFEGGFVVVGIGSAVLFFLPISSFSYLSLSFWMFRMEWSGSCYAVRWWYKWIGCVVGLILGRSDSEMVGRWYKQIRCLWIKLSLSSTLVLCPRYGQATRSGIGQLVIYLSRVYGTEWYLVIQRNKLTFPNMAK